MKLTPYGERKVLDWLYKNDGAVASPVSHYGLLKATPSEVSDGTEADYTGYAGRQAHDAADWGAAASDGAGATTIKNSATLDVFGVNTGVDQGITAIGFYDAATAGNLIGWLELSATLTLSSGDKYAPTANQLTGGAE